MEAIANTIQLKNVSKAYSGITARNEVLKDFSYDFPQGSFNVILGKSGSGKTTLLKMIGALLHPTKGEVIFKGRKLGTLNFGELAEIRRTHFGFMFQEAGLLSHLTNAENISFPKLLENPEQTAELAEYLGISHRLHSFPEECSLGEKQRVLLARAMINRPEYIIADEPTANLDWSNALRSMELLKGYSEKGSTIFVATHDERLTDLATNIIKMDKL